MPDNNSVTEMTIDNLSDAECRCEYPYQHDYAEYLNDRDFYQGIYIGDINDEETDAATFEEKLEEIEKLVQENSRLSEAFPIVHIDDENFEDYVRENLPCFRN